MTAFTTDSDGYLVELDLWSESVAQALAEPLGIKLTAEHWQVLYCARDFYIAYQLSPVMRPMVNALKGQHPQLANSLTLMRLFPSPTDATKPATPSPTNGSPAKRIACIAGLPRPTNCL
jgi:tRNA 2-thiouridine synthesizing protein E